MMFVTVAVMGGGGGFRSRGSVGVQLPLARNTFVIPAAQLALRIVSPFWSNEGMENWKVTTTSFVAAVPVIAFTRLMVSTLLGGAVGPLRR